MGLSMWKTVEMKCFSEQLCLSPCSPEWPDSTLLTGTLDLLSWPWVNCRQSLQALGRCRQALSECLISSSRLCRMVGGLCDERSLESLLSWQRVHCELTSHQGWVITGQPWRQRPRRPVWLAVLGGGTSDLPTLHAAAETAKAL